MSCMSKDGFMFSCPICVTFILCFFWLTALAITSSRTLQSSGEWGHFCFVPDISGKESSVSALSMILAIGFLKIVFIRLRKFPFIPTLFLFQGPIELAHCTLYVC